MRRNTIQTVLSADKTASLCWLSSEKLRPLDPDLAGQKPERPGTWFSLTAEHGGVRMSFSDSYSSSRFVLIRISNVCQPAIVVDVFGNIARKVELDSVWNIGRLLFGIGRSPVVAVRACGYKPRLLWSSRCYAAVTCGLIGKTFVIPAIPVVASWLQSPV